MTVFDALLEGYNFFVYPLSDMDASTDHSQERRKTLHLVRHAQGIHNVGVNGPEALLSQELFDAELTTDGVRQTCNLRKDVRERGLPKKIDLVITSPLSRTLRTAVRVFGCESQTNGSDHVHQSMMENNDSCTKSKVNYPPIVAVELCRERLGLYPCDKRRSISEYQTRFPAIDFKLIESEDDSLWKADIREPVEEVAARGMAFIKWLWTRPEKEIAIVSHGIFLQQTLMALINNPRSLEEKNLCSRFKNCELRSVVIVERSTLGNNSTVPPIHTDVTRENIQRDAVPLNCTL